jgi:demethylmenaquinone methyltransferase / 2-methoxy-6-polyprenyl-1,4-benzoquinol methylase
VLDLACGTGDLALAATELAPTATAMGIDASPRMIEQAERRRERAGADRVRYRVGDMSRLDLPDASVDVVTAGYALRNVPDPAVAIAEIARVLAPGGRVLTLDFYRPRPTVWRVPLLAYLSAAGNAVGWLWHREPVVYGYIARSIEHFMSWEDFSMALERERLFVERVHRRLLGGVAIHRAVKR